MSLRLPSDIAARRAEIRQAIVYTKICLLILAGFAAMVFWQARIERETYEHIATVAAPFHARHGVPADVAHLAVDTARAPQMMRWSGAQRTEIRLGDLRDTRLRVKGATVVHGRVLGVDLFHGPLMKDISPVDISLSWQEAATDAAFSRQSTFHTRRQARVRGFTARELRRMTNTHLIPASGAVYDALRAVTPDDRIVLAGHPVTVHRLGARPWDSDMRYGDENCEILLITGVRVESPDGQIKDLAALDLAGA